MDPPPNVIAFRDLLRARFPEAHVLRQAPDSIETGIACLDEFGLRAGCISEVVAQHPSAGAALLLVALLEGRTEAIRQPVALVDAADAFNPRGVSHETRERLLWLRCRDVEQAIKATDLLLRDGNMPRVLVDVAVCPAHSVRRVPSHAWHRLRMLAEKSGTVCCVFTAFPSVPCARSRLVLEQAHILEVLDRPCPDLVSQLRGRVVQRGAAFAEAGLAKAV